MVPAGGKECLELLEPARDHYDFEEGRDVSVSENGRRFCASSLGTRNDNPSEPSEIAEPEKFPDVRRQSVTFEFRDTHVMKVKYSVGCCVATGRNFVFAGAPQPLLACNSPPPSPPSAAFPSTPPSPPSLPPPPSPPPPPLPSPPSLPPPPPTPPS